MSEPSCTVTLAGALKFIITFAIEFAKIAFTFTKPFVVLEM
jgi:hypothetical protein